jgi:drug/metabolite transporter (DMT)-like permease
MGRDVRRRIAVLVVTSAVAIVFFTRTPGSESVRWVQILLLFAAGVSAGVALALSRNFRRIGKE